MRRKINRREINRKNLSTKKTKSYTNTYKSTNILPKKYNRKLYTWGKEPDLIDDYGRDLQHQKVIEKVKNGTYVKSRGGNFVQEDPNDMWRVTPTRDNAFEIRKIPYRTKPAFSGNSQRSSVPPNYYIKPTPTGKRKK